jgi:hypothetical protein
MKKDKSKKITTSDEFNRKYEKYLENESFYGLAINHPGVVAYLDKEFAKEIESNSDFVYSQIKLKFGAVRVYTNSNKNIQWATVINELLTNDIIPKEK